MWDNEWIPVEKRTPDPGQKIIATLRCKGKSIVTIVRYDGAGMEGGCRLTAWMPVPTVYISDIARMYMMICMHLRRSRGWKLRS